MPLLRRRCRRQRIFTSPQKGSVSYPNFSSRTLARLRRAESGWLLLPAQILDLALDVVPVLCVRLGREVSPERVDRLGALATLLVGEPEVVVRHRVPGLLSGGTLVPRQR